jgi:hypothetical protein
MLNIVLQLMRNESSGQNAPTRTTVLDSFRDRLTEQPNTDRPLAALQFELAAAS